MLRAPRHPDRSDALFSVDNILTERKRRIDGPSP
jgi:hypothetical protein